MYKYYYFARNTYIVLTKAAFTLGSRALTAPILPEPGRALEGVNAALACQTIVVTMKSIIELLFIMVE